MTGWDAIRCGAEFTVEIRSPCSGNLKPQSDGYCCGLIDIESGHLSQIKNPSIRASRYSGKLWDGEIAGILVRYIPFALRSDWLVKSSIARVATVAVAYRGPLHSISIVPLQFLDSELLRHPQFLPRPVDKAVIDDVGEFNRLRDFSVFALQVDQRLHRTVLDAGIPG